MWIKYSTRSFTYHVHVYMKTEMCYKYIVFVYTIFPNFLMTQMSTLGEHCGQIQQYEGKFKTETSMI